MDIEEIALICKALSENNRILIIENLVEEKLCACDLLERLNLSQSTLSYHMKFLEKSGLVNTKIEGKWSFYSINCSKFKEFKSYISKIDCSKERGNCSC